MLIDRATIFIRSGKGGDGCASFRREKFVPKGGPDGGDGGKGGDVVLVVDESLSTLLPLTPRPHYRAKRGMQGMGQSRTGAHGEDCIVPVPRGTLVYDRDGGTLLVDLSEPGQRFVAADGGKGGLGNEHFKSSTNQVPRESTPGGEAIDRTLDLELKLIADIGLVGLPNAGKSTLLRSVSRATPKVADYPFTTITPHLGIADLGESGGASSPRRLVLADIPGLIDGAAGGAGLGHDFLRHVERTKVLVHLVDLQPFDGSDPVANYQTVRRELFAHSALLAEKPEIIVLNKIDLVPAGDRRDVVRRVIGRLGLRDDERPLMASGATGEGTRDLLEACWRLLEHDVPEGWRKP